MDMMPVVIFTLSQLFETVIVVDVIVLPYDK